MEVSGPKENIKPLREKYPKVCFWRKNMYKQQDRQPGQSDPMREETPRQKSYKKLRFLENDQGVPYTIGKIAVVCKTMKRAFLDLDSFHEVSPPATWQGHALDCHRKGVFSALYKAHPDIEYCADDWKANQIAIERYSHYRQHHPWPAAWLAPVRRIKEEPQQIISEIKDDHANGDPSCSSGKPEPAADVENMDPAMAPLPDTAQKRAALTSAEDRCAAKKPKIGRRIIIANPILATTQPTTDDLPENLSDQDITGSRVTFDSEGGQVGEEMAGSSVPENINVTETMTEGSALPITAPISSAPTEEAARSDDQVAKGNTAAQGAAVKITGKTYCCDTWKAKHPDCQEDLAAFETYWKGLTEGEKRKFNNLAAKAKRQLNWTVASTA
ncbi:uncharacterized protein PHACADRAFT_193955 [Phanerochaete carnosa HHB-10118-sp]|uniref:Uncharacterized protein n=1 Tax=Phanerochaete carnosa (strain HHB-10118-sp) TaxID=650164 RepID=K5WBK1_PHACS|nr:uncharacterized protein PHACADRAFT_193955 [Phanerochaete carnosa HHB-10118-sp]EKM56339.1 hypothetical protein PHACADRAFT_193955 [Phanerochaete carnosa HHB-10118-sp]